MVSLLVKSSKIVFRFAMKKALDICDMDCDDAWIVTTMDCDDAWMLTTHVL